MFVQKINNTYQCTYALNMCKYALLIKKKNTYKCHIKDMRNVLI